MQTLRLPTHTAILIVAALLTADHARSAEPTETRQYSRSNTTSCCVSRDTRGRISRSNAARHQFANEQACPSTGQHRLPCPGWRIDHIIPLKRCGTDTTVNMQWLTIEAWKAKSRWE